MKKKKEQKRKRKEYGRTRVRTRKGGGWEKKIDEIYNCLRANGPTNETTLEGLGTVSVGVAILDRGPHYGRKQTRMLIEVLGHSLVRLLVCSHRSLVCSFAHFAHSLARGKVNF